jgi:peptide deformylase
MKSAMSRIISLPNQHLRQRSQKIGLITDDILKIIEVMKEATLEWEDTRKYEVGVALAAVQIDELLRAIVIRDDFDNKQNRGFKVFINPVITKYEGDIIEDYEGCLSVKDIYGKVPRYEKVKVKAIGLDGREFRITAKGFFARVLQHEIDHINGKLFIDQIKNDQKAFYILAEDGQLIELDYDKDIKTSNILW